MGGTFIYTFTTKLAAVDMATGVETATTMAENSDDTIGIGGGIITDVERESVLSTNTWINLRKYTKGAFQLVGKIDLVDVTYDEVKGPMLPSLDASLFLVTTQDPFDSDSPTPGMWRIRVIDHGGRIAGELANYYSAVWLGPGRAVFAGDDGLFVANVGASGFSPPERIGKAGLGAPGRSPEGPSVSPDGKMLTFVQGDMAWRMGIDGSNLVQVTAQVQEQENPIFSPDGSKIIVQHGDCRTTWTYQIVVPADAAAGPADIYHSPQLDEEYAPMAGSGRRNSISACGPTFWLP
jgi:hypothetical protein